MHKKKLTTLGTQGTGRRPKNIKLKRWGTWTPPNTRLNQGDREGQIVHASYRILTMLLIQPIYVGHHYTPTITNNVNKTWALLQTTGGKDELNIIFMRKS